MTTDLAARGIHVSGVTFVVNYDFPSNLEQYVHRCGRAGRNYQHEVPIQGSASATAVATVYSFFTRNLAPLAQDLVRLLELHRQWVDPNLKELVQIPHTSTPKQQQRAKPQLQDSKDLGYRAHQDGNSSDDGGDSDVLLNDKYSANRIVFKRSSNVSDASSSSGDDDNKTE